MANSNHANYGKIGLVLMMGLVAIVGSVIYIGGFGKDSRDVFLVETYFDYPVNGLSKGSDVLFQGMKVGTVKSMNLVSVVYGKSAAAEDAYTTSVLLALNGKMFNAENLATYKRAGLRALVSSNILTGLSKIELNPAPDAEPPRALAWEVDVRHPLVHPTKPMVDEFTDSVKKIFVKLESMNFEKAWADVEKAAENTAKLTENVNTLIEGNSANVAELVNNLKELAANLNQLSDELKDNPSLLLRSTDPDPLAETK